METADLWITDGHQAILNAIVAKFPTSQRQRCIVHKMDNIKNHVPEKYRDTLHADLREIDRAKVDQAAEKHEKVRARGINSDDEWQRTAVQISRMVEILKQTHSTYCFANKQVG